jgi:3-oxoadipate enol-lactonase
LNPEPRTREPLVLVPGIQGRWEYMRPAVDALAERFDVVTFTLHGATLDEYVAQVARELDARGFDRAVICGVSFGGAVALRFAAAHAARTRALVLVSTPGPSWRLRPRHDFYARWPLVLGPLFLVETPWRLRDELRVTFENRRGRWAYQRRVLRTLLSAPVSLTSMAARARMIERADSRTDCARITAPTLVVTGERHLDRVVPVDGSSEYARLIRGAQATTIERTGHLGSVTRPEEFAAMVERFVRSVRLQPDHAQPHRVA